MLSSFEQAFVGRDEKRAPLKTPAWEATNAPDRFYRHCLLKVKDVSVVGKQT